MSSTSLTLTQHKVTIICDALVDHPLFQIINDIHYTLDEMEPDDYGNIGGWGIMIHCIANTYERPKETLTQYAESWLWLGELRNIVRTVCNTDPDTTEEDEIFFRDHPEEIPIAFETFIGGVIFNLVGTSSLS